MTEWNGIFLEKVMEKLGFDNKWISFISLCIRFVSFSVLVNGAPHGHFTPQKRTPSKGSPIPLFVSIICRRFIFSYLATKGFWTFHGVSQCRVSPKVSYLLFTDNSLLFCRASQQECNTILEILQLYEATSGQQINRDKTQLFFSSNTNQTMRNQIKTALGVSTTTHIESYLGVPSFVVKAKKKKKIQLYQRTDLAQDLMVEGKTTLTKG